MIELLRAARELLDAPARRRVLISLAGSVVIALLDALALAMILPFVQALASPNTSIDVPLISDLFDVSPSSGNRDLVVIGGAIVGLFVVRSVLAIVFVYWQYGFLSVSEARMAASLLRRYIDAPYVFHLERNSSELIRNVQAAVPVFFSNVVLAFLTIATDVIVMVAVSAALVLQEPLITGLAVALAGLVGVVYQRWASPRSLRIGQRSQVFVRESQQHIQQALDGVKEVKALGREREFVEVFRRSRMGWADVRHKGAFLQTLPRYYVETAMTIVVLVISLVLIWTRPGDEALAVLALFGAAGFRLMASLNRVLQGVTQLRVGTEPARVLRRDFATYAANDENDDDVSRLELTVSLDVDDVVFQYDRTPSPALAGVSVSIRRGEFLGIVGRSGSGKTTLVDVLLGLLEPSRGSVEVDGTDIFTRLPAWRRTIGYVPQTIYLTDDSLRRNIAFGLVDDEIDDDIVGEAVSRAQLDELVARLPDGLDTFVGERGIRLSGGQRQRIGIARALYRRPSVLILDEATSALDADTESRISETLEALRGSVTVVMIAHRLSTVRACDRLVLLEEGVVQGIGSFAELQRAHPNFARLVELSSLATGEGRSAAG